MANEHDQVILHHIHTAYIMLYVVGGVKYWQVSCHGRSYY